MSSQADLTTRSLGLEIVRCPVFAACHRPGGETNPCHEVATWYGSDADGTTYYPEPWTGHLASAPILFVASNPGAGEKGSMPDSTNWLTSKAGDDQLFASFDGAFDDGQRPGIADGTHQVDLNGNRSRAVRYWSWCWYRAQELLERDPRPGADYAITEAVRCGTQSEHGVEAAFDQCTSRYFDRTISASPARVIICTGKYAERAFQARGVTFADGGSGPAELLGRERIVLRVPHPNARGEEWALAAHVPAHLDAARAMLRNP